MQQGIQHTVYCETGELDAVGDAQAVLPHLVRHTRYTLVAEALRCAAHDAGLTPDEANDVNSSFSVGVQGTADELKAVLADVASRIDGEPGKCLVVLGDPDDAAGYETLVREYESLVLDNYLQPA